MVLAARRPDSLRVELPGPSGPRLVVVAREGRLCAVFPGERAVLRSAARADDLRQLLGVALEPAGVLDLLLGTPPPDAREVRVDWGAALPRRVRARLPDGGRVDIRVDDAELGPVLPDAAFDDRLQRGAPPVEPLNPAGPIVCPAFAKVNLGLEVLGLRDDGYHELRTVFQTIALADEVVLSPASAECRLTCDHPEVPSDERNLALRAALDLRAFASVAAGVSIELRKRIPHGGGLGGGSSDAAAVLLGLDHLWGLGLGRAGLLPLARRLGADVPYFLWGGTALGISRGDEIYPLAGQVRGFVALVDPRRPVSTAAVFRRLDARLTPRANSTSIARFVAGTATGDPGYGFLVNDLEGAALEEAPDLAKGVEAVRASLRREGARLTLMSGSGSSYFGLFAERQQAIRARSALVAAGFECVVARTLSLGAYRRAWARALGGPSR